MSTGNTDVPELPVHRAGAQLAPHGVQTDLADEELYDAIMAVNASSTFLAIRQASPDGRWLTGQVIGATGGMV